QRFRHFFLKCADSLLCFLYMQFGNGKRYLHRVYLVIAAVMGCVFLLLQPAGVVPDEIAHWYNTYHYSNQMMGVQEAEKGRLSMREEDSEIPLVTHAREQEVFNAYWDSIPVNGHQTDIVPTKNDYHEVGTPYQYLGGMFGISIGRLLGLGGMMTFLLGRILNLVIFILLTAFAIKKLPFGKMALFIVALMPMTLQQAASYSPDVTINGLVFVVVALSLHLAYRAVNKDPEKDAAANTVSKEMLPEVSGKIPEKTGNISAATEKKSFFKNIDKRLLVQYIVLAAACLLLLFLKGYVYAVFCFLPLMIAWKKRKTCRFETFFPLGISVVCAVIMLLQIGNVFPRQTTNEAVSGNQAAVETEAVVAAASEKAAEKALSEIESAAISETAAGTAAEQAAAEAAAAETAAEITDAEESNALYTISYLLKDPKECFRILFNTAVMRDGFYYETMVGTPLQWLNAEVNRLIIYFFTVLLVLAALRRKSQTLQPGVKAKLYIHLISWICVAAVLAAMLLSWSHISDHKIEGVQGRYFIPPFMAMLLTVPSRGISISDSYDTGILLAALFGLFWLIQSLLL
ncbi:MAG: DUF2142 domain-containing protein, partial [Eubacterium sp.]|nr:DUF2142 domain-containing protein [Eubacterium sp.]